MQLHCQMLPSPAPEPLSCPVRLDRLRPVSCAPLCHSLDLTLLYISSTLPACNELKSYNQRAMNPSWSLWMTTSQYDHIPRRHQIPHFCHDPSPRSVRRERETTCRNRSFRRLRSQSLQLPVHQLLASAQHQHVRFSKETVCDEAVRTVSGTTLDPSRYGRKSVRQSAVTLCRERERERERATRQSTNRNLLRWL